MATKKKPVKVPAGIYLKGTPGKISVHIHAANGNKLAVMTGYNTKASATKAIGALDMVLAEWYEGIGAVDQVKRRTAPKKPLTPKRSPKG